MASRLPTPRIIDPASVPTLRWGVIGTGIAAKFVAAIHAHSTQRATAVAARDVARTQTFAVEHGIRDVYTDTSAMINSSGIDAVYIATPHPAHHDLALEAIAAGKHVLVEKPIAMSAAEAQEMTSAGRAAGVLVMEAMWTRYLPQADIIRQVLSDGLLGDVHLVRADFGFAMPFLPDHRMWNSELGGGALLDAGVYPISFVSSVLGAPSSVTAVGTMTSTGVDARANLLLPAADGAVGIASTSMVTSMSVTAEIFGSDARLQVLSPFFAPSGVTLATGVMESTDNVTWRDETLTLHEGMSCQATAFASYVEEGRVESPLHSHEETVSVMATIDEARRQLRSAAPAEG